MEMTQEIIDKLTNLKKIGKEKIILLALAGLLLIGSSYFEKVDNKEKTVKHTEKSISKESYENKSKKEIINMIESIDGVTNVNVMITFKSGNEKILQVDKEESQESGEKKSSKVTTVIFNGSQEEYPYIIKEIYPQIEGVAVTAKGLKYAEKVNEITNMINALFNIPVHKISIISND